MDDSAYDLAVGENVRAACMAKFGSVRGGAIAAGIPGVTMDRKLRGIDSFKLIELRRLARVTGRKVRSFLPSESKVGA